MTQVFQRDPGSFRDPSGYVFTDGNRIIRSISPSALKEFEAVKVSGLLEVAIKRQLLIDCQPVSDGALSIVGKGGRGETPDALIEHPRIPVISYPYEWTFTQLKDAALRHLDLQMLALAYDFELSDATAYNMQFAAAGPLHIDVLSLRHYLDGRPWEGYNQFCRQFLFPLLIESTLGIAFQRIYRGNMAGVDPNDIKALIPAWRRHTSLNLFLHVQLQASAVQKASSNELSGRLIHVPKIPKTRYLAMLEGLRDWIASLESGRPKKTYWADYAAINSYSDQEKLDKQSFIESIIRGWGCDSVVDVGGNAGDYSESALAGGASCAYCLDSDIDALEVAYQKRKSRQPGLLPLVMDWSDPSPSQGWAGIERKALKQRMQVDAVIALAVVHHIVIGGNIPLEAFVDQLFAYGQSVIVEFVPKSDPMVQGLLRSRDDIFHDYTEENFVRLLESRSHIQAVCRIREGGRVLFACNSKMP